MKNILTITALLLFSLSFSQIVSRSDAWSGIITDNSGNPLVNTNITLKFTYTDNGTTTLYSEQHVKTTDNYGFVTANIGQGTVLQAGTSLRYTISNLKLKVEVNTGSGFITLSDDFPKAVPFANAATYAGNLTDNMNQITPLGNNGIVIDGKNKVNVWANGVNEVEINPNGLKISDLAGTGSREVVVDATGQLQRKSVQTKNLSISGAAFENEIFKFHPQSGLRNSTAAAISNVSLKYNINLPDNATIKDIKIVYLDNSSSNLMFNLYRHTDTSNTATSIFSFNTSVSTSASWQENPINNPDHLVSNFNNSYFLEVLSTSWPTGTQLSNTLGFRRIVITYEE